MVLAVHLLPFLLLKQKAHDFYFRYQDGAMQKVPDYYFRYQNGAMVVVETM